MATVYELRVNPGSDAPEPSDGDIEVALENAFEPHLFSVYSAPTTAYLIYEVDGTSASAVPKVVGVALSEQDAERAVGANDDPYRQRRSKAIDITGRRS